MFILSQILGIFAIICWIFSIQQENKEKILLCQIIANTLYAIEYSLLNAFTAAAMNIVSLLRCTVFYQDEKKNRKITTCSFFFFLIMIVLLGVITYTNILSIIPILITLIYTYSVWQSNLKITRIMFLLCGIIWIYYNIQVEAYVSIIGNGLEIISGIIALLRFKEVKK